MLTTSFAMSRSLTRLFAALRFSEATPRLVMVCCRRLIIAPSLERLLLTVLIAESILSIATEAAAASPTEMEAPLVTVSEVELMLLRERLMV
ncbi:hypothetical protein D3C87_1455540 [compost metagenome]